MVKRGRPKGYPKYGGRKKGSANHVTTKTRELVSGFVDGNLDKLQTLFDECAAKDPKDAFNMIAVLLEYTIPKLARQEVVGSNGGPLEYRRVFEDADLEIMKRFSGDEK